MKAIEWKDDFSVNDTKIDLQHKKLMRLINKLCEHKEASADSDVIGETLTDLLYYVKEHFRDEEVYLKTFNYPKLIAHIEEHRKFSYKIGMFSLDVIQKKQDLTQEMIDFLKNWWYEHIIVEDQDYKNYLLNE
jgi:hemerythrin-like metal-binding protein